MPHGYAARIIEAAMEHWRYKLIIMTTTVILLIVVSFAGFSIYRVSVQPMLTQSQQSLVIHFEKNTSASALINDLTRRKLIHSRQPLLGLVVLKGLSSQLKAGIYQINPGESALQFVSRVAQGDVLKFPFTIIEGTTKKQVISNLKTAPYLSYNPSDWLEVKSEQGSDEGMLLADTYIYEAGSGSAAILARSNADLSQYLEQCWLTRDSGLPYKSAYEMLIAASILEKETAISKEKKLVAGVIVNRLRKNMRLQVDPTVIYALGDSYQGKLTREGLHIDSPFNTYKYRGLPPTPIAMVGREAIEAAAHPTQTDYLYFVAKGNGAHHFSVTYEEQKQAIEKFLK